MYINRYYKLIYMNLLKWVDETARFFCFGGSSWWNLFDPRHTWICIPGNVTSQCQYLVVKMTKGIYYQPKIA